VTPTVPDLINQTQCPSQAKGVVLPDPTIAQHTIHGATPHPQGSRQRATRASSSSVHSIPRPGLAAGLPCSSSARRLRRRLHEPQHRRRVPRSPLAWDSHLAGTCFDASNQQLSVCAHVLRCLDGSPDVGVRVLAPGQHSSSSSAGSGPVLSPVYSRAHRFRGSAGLPLSKTVSDLRSSTRHLVGALPHSLSSVGVAAVNLAAAPSSNPGPD